MINDSCSEQFKENLDRKIFVAVQIDTYSYYYCCLFSSITDVVIE